MTDIIVEQKARIVQIFTEKEADEIFEYLQTKQYEYHKQYKRFNKDVKVPRGQASYTTHKDIHYDYKQAGGSPTNEVMCERLLDITNKVNKELGTNYNTILLNVYKDGKDHIAPHSDSTAGWMENTGFATVAFGYERKFVIQEISTKQKTKLLHKKGMCIEVSSEMNKTHKHGLPACVTKGNNQCRISLTFRQIKEV